MKSQTWSRMPLIPGSRGQRVQSSELSSDSKLETNVSYVGLGLKNSKQIFKGSIGLL